MTDLTRKERLDLVNKKKIEVCKKFYGGICFICHKPLKKRITFHHLWYSPQEKSYKDFPTESGKGYDSITYNEYLLPYVEMHPKQFLAVDSGHHQAIERITRYGDKVLTRLLKARKMTRMNRT